MAKEKSSPKKQRLPRWLTGFLVYVGSVVGILVILFGVFSIIFAGEIYPRVSVTGISVGGQKPTTAKTTIQTELTKQPLKPVILTDSTGHSFTVKPDEVGATYDLDRSTNAAYQVGRGKDWLANLSQKITTPLFGLDIPAKISVNNEQLSKTVNEISEKVTSPEKNAVLVIKNGNISITPEESGQGIENDTLRQQILNALGSNQADPVAIKLKKREPTVKAEALNKLRAKAALILAQPILLTYKEQSYTATPAIIGSWLETKSSDKLFQPKVELSINDQKVTDYITGLGSKIDIIPQNARLAVVNGQVTIIQNSADGLRLKQDLAKTDLLRLLSLRQDGFVDSPRATASEETSPSINPSSTSSPTDSPTIATNQIVLTAEVKKAEVTNDNISQIGIKERISIATTDFKNSPANRQANIGLGTKLFNGIILKPGDQFSAVKSLGRIDEAAGFKPELVIKEDRLTPEVGGGLCQVSTTLFRSVMNAGLQIDERRNHSERVSYYEARLSNPDPDDYVTINAKTLVGMDATIYDPSPDFKFTNDTASYVLIQGHVEGTRLSFELFGTKDGRMPHVDGPYILSTTPAPTDILYIDDASLPTGTTKLKERAHDGAKTSFTYSVTRDGQQLHKSTFSSSYSAWQGKYYRGTGPAVSPSPSPGVSPSFDPNAAAVPTPVPSPT